MILGDYHTHTIFSHGQGTIEENVERARQIGLKEIAITDHGLNHILFGLRPYKIRKMRQIVEKLNAKYNDIQVLLGVESNLISKNGDIDIKKDEYSYFDIVLCGFHKVVWSNSFSSQFNFIGKNDLLEFIGKNKSDNLIKENTRALIECVKRNKIDVLSHPNHDMLVDVVEVAKACVDTNTMFEINSKKVHLSTEQFEKVKETGVKFIINSDAHSPDRVGDFSLGLQVLAESKIPSFCVANFNSLPNLKNFKR